VARTDARHPLVSPVFADLRGLPPTLVQVGTDELLLGDARRLHERLRGRGCRGAIGGVSAPLARLPGQRWPTGRCRPRDRIGGPIHSRWRTAHSRMNSATARSPP